jgi:putative Holliday junction resolvase
VARIVGIDYGSKRVGIAVTDPLQLIATALATVPSHEAMNFLRKYITQEKVEAIVVGEARELNGSPTDSAPLIEDFVKGLRKAFRGMKIETRDERFTSKIAFNAMISSGMKKKDRRDKGIIDRISAVVILQDYLEEIKNK